MHIWQLQDAKNKFSQLVNLALSEGPQLVTRNGKDAAIVLSVETYRTLTKTKPSLNKFLLSVSFDDFEIERETNFTREDVSFDE